MRADLVADQEASRGPIEDGEERQPGEVSGLLARINQGDPKAAEELFPIVLEELHRRARREMRGQPNEHTLQPTALVNEAYLKLVGSNRRDWRDRRHFLGVAARAMKSILVDHARAKNRQKRTPTMLDRIVAHYDQQSIDTVALSHALSELAQRDPVAAELVELRYYTGLSEREAAQALEISLRTAQRKWVTAKAYLRTKLR